MTRIMYDGIGADAAVIRRLWQPGQLVAWYVAGNSFIWTAAEKALFPPSALVSITLTAAYHGGDVLDVERGGASPGEAGGWIRARRAQGYYRPTVYCSLSVVGEVRRDTGSLILGRDYDIWDAHYDGSAAPDFPLAAAKQYKNTGQYDLSAVYDAGWPHRHAPTAPVPPPVPHAPVWPAGVTLRFGSQGGAVMALQRALSDSGERGERGITVDGSFGAQTKTAVGNFQQAHGLAVDYAAGPRTRAAMVSRGLLTAAGAAA